MIRPNRVQPIGNNQYRIDLYCQNCKEPKEVIVPLEGWRAWNSGDQNIQTALPGLSVSDRELLISGTCGECWKLLFPPEDLEEPEEPVVKSYAPEVIADSTGVWTGNGLRFAKREDAEAWVSDLSLRWFMVRDTRVVESSDEPNQQTALHSPAKVQL